MEASGQLHASAALPPEKESVVHIGWKTGWEPEPVWTQWNTEKSFPLPGIGINAGFNIINV
jgi:hypothetical protein